MLELVGKIDHKRINRIGPFVSLKEKELRDASKFYFQIKNGPPQTPSPPLKANNPIIQNQ